MDNAEIEALRTEVCITMALMFFDPVHFMFAILSFFCSHPDLYIILTYTHAFAHAHPKHLHLARLPSCVASYEKPSCLSPLLQVRVHPQQT